ncbi:MAG: hypothetical protein AAF483_24040 [Planctomycetota bacterium]
MFGWFKPQCPLDSAAKRWIENRLQWLSGQFGLDVFTRRAMILPTSDFFPDPMDGSHNSVRNLLDQICRYMDVNPKRVELNLFTNKNDLGLVNEAGLSVPSGYAGLYDKQLGKTVIHLDIGELSNLPDLVGTMAHELAHLRLLGEGRLSGDEFDNELLTDLTAVFHGFGIFLGNSPRNWPSQYTKWPGTDLNCPEYMTLPMFAYALAHSAWFRRQEKPEWFSFLSFDLKPSFKQSLRYLRETKDSTFAPDEHA